MNAAHLKRIQCIIKMLKIVLNSYVFKLLNYLILKFNKCYVHISLVFSCWFALSQAYVGNMASMAIAIKAISQPFATGIFYIHASSILCINKYMENSVSHVTFK